MEGIDDSSSLPNASAPSVSDVEVKINGTAVTVTDLGFQRRVRYAPLNQKWFHLENALYLELATPIPTGGTGPQRTQPKTSGRARLFLLRRWTRTAGAVRSM